MGVALDVEVDRPVPDAVSVTTRAGGSLPNQQRFPPAARPPPGTVKLVARPAL